MADAGLYRTELRHYLNGNMGSPVGISVKRPVAVSMDAVFYAAEHPLVYVHPSFEHRQWFLDRVVGRAAVLGWETEKLLYGWRITHEDGSEHSVSACGFDLVHTFKAHTIFVDFLMAQWTIDVGESTVVYVTRALDEAAVSSESD